MLVIMRTANWLTAVLAIAIAAGLLDFLLRFPGWLRLAMLIAGVVAAAGFAVRHIGRAIRTWPALTALALRLERIYPHTTGNLASAVAFATEAHHDETPVSAVLARRTTASAQGMLNPREIDRLIDGRQTLLAVLLLGLVISTLAALAAGTPRYFAIGLARWTQPLGDARWPNRFAVESMTTAGIAPNNAPLPVAARVTKGDHENLRTSVVYRFETDGQPAGSWQRALLTRQNNASDHGGLYQRLIEPAAGAQRIAFYFEAGDDASPMQTIELIQPPTLLQATVDIAPPAYAADFLPPQRHDLLTPPRPAVTLDMLAGSRVTLSLAVAGSFEHLGSEATLAEIRQWAQENLAGLFDDLDPEQAAAMDVTHASRSADGHVAVDVAFRLDQPAQFRFRFADAFGTRYDDQRLFRFETREDRPPRGTILEPAGDESVLATAVVPLTAEAQDDVAVADLALTAKATHKARKDPSAGDVVELARDSSAKPRVTLTHSLDLAPFELKAGDELSIVAVVRDNYLLDGKQHDPVESTARRLIIIGAEELVRQLRTDLAEVRQRAVRARDAQQVLSDAPADRSSAQQQHDLAQRMASMQRTVAQLQQRSDRNRLDDAAVNEILREAQKLLEQGGASAEQAGDALDRAAAETANPQQQAQQVQQARAAQQATQQRLEDLVQLLDQGRDAYELKQQLVKIQKDQEAIADQTRKTLPRTLGQSLEQLSETDKEALRSIAEQQQNLSELTRQLVDRMRSTAAALDRQSQKTEDEATAEALRQAAETATQQALDQKMNEASKEASQNRLSQASTAQAQAADTIRQMMQQLGRTDQLKHEILQRKLMELVDSIRRLRDTQQAQLDRLVAADDLGDLDAPLLTLRRNTRAVADLARQADAQTVPIADLLTQAAEAQAMAIERLRASQVVKDDVETHEREALAKLEEALKLAEEVAAKNQDKTADEQKAKLIAAYKKALAEQMAIMDETTKLTGEGDRQRDRRWRGQSMQVGEKQLTLRGELSKIQQEQLSDTVVYRSVHEQMDSWASSAAGSLKKAQPDAATIFQQRMIASSIQALIDALAPDQPDEKFATPQGGGGGGGQGGKPPLIPPAAEVKLLRARQVTIHQATRQIDEAGGDAMDAAVRQKLVDHLAQQQSDLADSATKLLSQLQQEQDQMMKQMQPAPRDTPGPGPAPSPGPTPGPTPGPGPVPPPGDTP